MVLTVSRYIDTMHGNSIEVKKGSLIFKQIVDHRE
jgi:hypothetical protein